VLQKPGVGLYVSVGSPVAGRKLEVLSDTPGFHAKVYGALTPAPDLAGWGRPLASLSGARRETVTLPTSRGTSYRSYLIWIDKLPAAGQVKLDEVRLFG
jgi:hypothetical protein